MGTFRDSWRGLSGNSGVCGPDGAGILQTFSVDGKGEAPVCRGILSGTVPDALIIYAGVGENRPLSVAGKCYVLFIRKTSSIFCSIALISTPRM